MACIPLAGGEPMTHVAAAQILTHYGSGAHGIPSSWLTTPGFIGLSLGLDRLRTTAILQKVRYAIFRLSEVFYEWRFGIVSDKEILADELGITDSACHDYLATGYLRFRQLMKYIAIRPDEDVFLDFGSGMGRAVILAATYPFRKVIGVELVADLHVKALENVRRALGR